MNFYRIFIRRNGNFGNKLNVFVIIALCSTLSKAFVQNHMLISPHLCCIIMKCSHTIEIISMEHFYSIHYEFYHFMELRHTFTRAYTAMKWCLINLDKMLCSRSKDYRAFIYKKRHIDFTSVHFVQHSCAPSSWCIGWWTTREHREGENQMHYSANLCCAKSRVWRAINAITSHNQNLMNCFGTIW